MLVVQCNNAAVAANVSVFSTYLPDWPGGAAPVDGLACEPEPPGAGADGPLGALGAFELPAGAEPVDGFDWEGVEPELPGGEVGEFPGAEAGGLSPPWPGGDPELPGEPVPPPL